MVATIIAYLLALVFSAAGVWGLVDLGRGKIAKYDATGHVYACLWCLGLAWLSACAGGI